MRRMLFLSVAACLLLPSAVWARERSLQNLPKDVWDLTFSWTEPLKETAEQTQRTNPVAGLWRGLIYGTTRTADRATGTMNERESLPGPSAEKQFRYSF